MSELVEKLVSPWVLFRQGDRYQETIPFAKMPYVLESQTVGSGTANLTIEIIQNTDKKLILKASIDTLLTLQCQRCLGDLEQQLSICTERLILKKEPDLDVIDDYDADVLVCEDSFDVYSFAQEEILLAMPMIAKHENCQQGYQNKKEQANAETHQPFANLKDLLN